MMYVVYSMLALAGLAMVFLAGGMIHRPAPRINRNDFEFSLDELAIETSIDPKVAFEVVATKHDNELTAQVRFPDTTRNKRIGSEAVLYVQFYRDFGMAVRYVQLHGELRKKLGAKIALKAIEVVGKRDDDVLDEAEQLAKSLLDIDAAPADQSAPAAPEPHVTHDVQVAHEDKSSAPAEVNDLHPAFKAEGIFMVAGTAPYVSPEGKRGKPSFAVVIRKKSGDEMKLWGSDLERAIREADVLAGDRIRLTKYPKVNVKVGNRTVPKNIWTVDKLAA